MILIVDDHHDTGYLLARFIRHAGREAVCVTSGAAALALLAVRRPAVMVLDVNMPDVDGLEVLRTMKQTPAWRDVPVMMYSADTRHATMAAARRLGAVDFLVKGTVGVKTVIARIAELAAPPPPGAGPTDQSPPAG